MDGSAKHLPGPKLEGMLDAIEWPRQLKAAVIQPGAEPRLHGYAVETDFALHYEPADVVYLALTGELPTDDARRGLAVAMVFLSCVGIHEGPTHAAFLARVGNAPARAVLEVAAVALAERGRLAVEELHDFLVWLDAGSPPPPGQYLTDDPEQARSVARLRAAVPASLAVPALSHPLTRPAAVAAVLHACGIRRSEHLEGIWTLAAMAPTFSEAMTAKPLAFREYPMDTPGFRYHGDR